MLTPAYLAGCADQLAALFSQLETDITTDIARRIAKMGENSFSSQWQAYRLNEAKAAYDACQKMIKDYKQQASAEIEDALLDGCNEALNVDDTLYHAAQAVTQARAQETVSNAIKDIIIAGLKKTNGVMNNLTKTTARDASHAIQNALDRAYMQVMSGAFSFTQATLGVIRDLGAKGYSCFNYDSGVHTSLEAAARRALLTGINQTTAELQLQRADELGTELVEVSSHAGARPSHAVWQGEVYSLHGKAGAYRDFYSATGYGTGDGLCGWNCYHNFYPYIEGTPRAFDKDPTSELGKTNNELYKEKQQQRYYERKVRESRRQCATLSAAMDSASPSLRDALKPEFSKASVKLKRREATLKEFCKQTGLTSYDASRVSTAGFGKSTSARAVWANRKAQAGLINLAKYVNINTKGVERRITIMGQRVKPMPKSRIQKIKKAFARRGGIILQNEETQAHLIAKGAQGATIDAETILLVNNPSRATVFEELIHTFQFRTGKIDSSSMLSIAQAEVEAKEKLLRYAKAYKLSNAEIEETKTHLAEYRAIIKLLMRS